LRLLTKDLGSSINKKWHQKVCQHKRIIKNFEPYKQNTVF
jgi:hypothetical protein